MKDNNILSEKDAKYLLEVIFKKKIANIIIEGIEYYESIIEYDFSLIKANVIYNDNKNDEIYLRIIKGGKIKESIFCFWSFLYENYIKTRNINNENTIQKAIITQIASEKNVSSLLLTIDSKLNYCAEINLVELKKYLKNKEKIVKEERWGDNLEINDNDILFIAKKMY